LGALPTENLQFKTNTNYLLDQNRAAESRFQKLRGMGARTNYLEEFSRTVEAVLNSDASERIKEDTRKLTLLELAHQRELAAEKDKAGGHLERALQLLAEYVERYSRDAAVPEVLLRQGYLVRRLDLKEEAIEKFYLVLRSVPRIEGRNIAYSRRLVMMAQSAIADTCADLGRHAEAAELYGRMLQTKSEELEVETVRIKQLRSLRESATDGILERQAMGFLEDFPDSDYIPEARYFLAHTLRHQKKRDAGCLGNFASAMNWPTSSIWRVTSFRRFRCIARWPVPTPMIRPASLSGIRWAFARSVWVRWKRPSRLISRSWMLRPLRRWAPTAARTPSLFRSCGTWQR
jgi:tetratricopeptide (TPR) repeat protein